MILFLLQKPDAALVRWTAPVEAGILNEAVNEASGLAVSRRYPDRLYHINDSGDTGRFLITSHDGGHARSVAVSGFNPMDMEDLAIGPCDAGECLFLADIGDNARRRPEIEIVLVEERAEFPPALAPLLRMRLRYPDGPHDSESLAVHPDGTIYLLTKEYERRGTALAPGVPRLYKIARKQWRNGGTQILRFVADVDLGKLLPGSPDNARLTTGMDISPDGARVLILAYMDAIELAIDFSKPFPRPAAWREGKEYQRVPLVNLQQQEALAYMPDGRSFIYDTERRPGSPDPARLMRVWRVQDELGVMKK